MKNKNKPKGQAAFEFISYFALFLLVFVLALAYLSNEELREIRQREDFLAKEVAFQIASEINFAAKAGDGYSRNASIPVRAGTIEYNASIKQGFIYLNWTRGGNERIVLAPIATANVTTTNLKTQPSDGAIIINASKGYISINNTDGKIYVNQ
jgi:hypothetical protein